MQRGEVRNPVMVLVLCMVTCGIYNIIWILAVMDELNKGLGREDYNGTKEVILLFVTCGLWGMWLLWRICNSVAELQESWGVQPQFDGTILFLLHFVYVGPYFVQDGLNKAWEQGTPGGAGYGGGAA